MNRKPFYTLAVLLVGVSLLGCQSEPQKMIKGAAKEYQDRYNNCLDSVEKFSRYAGFGFAEEKGVCQCNESVCSGNETCNVHGKCEKIEPEPECKKGQKICISPSIGQVCEDGHWSEPINCEENKVCNTKVKGDEQICAPECDVGYCHQEADGVGMFTKCKNGEYNDVISCAEENNNVNNVSCTFDRDNNTSKCGMCLDGIYCIGNQNAKICKNGTWGDDLECTMCLENECYSAPLCVNKPDTGGSEVLITSGSGEQIVLKKCDGGCDDSGTDCKDNRASGCKVGDKRCDEKALEVCRYGIDNDENNGVWSVDLCTGGMECDPVALKCVCRADSPECKSSTECPEDCPNDCTNGKCNKPGLECLIRCAVDEDVDIDSCTCKCKANATRCDNDEEIACIDGSWGTPVSCNRLGCADSKKCKTSSEPQCPSECPDGEECDINNGECKCKEGYYKCVDGSVKQCTDNRWNEILKCQDGCLDVDPFADLDDDDEIGEDELRKTFCENSAVNRCESDGYLCSDAHLIQCTTKDGLKDVDSNFVDVGDYEFQNCIKNSNGKYYCAFSNDTGMTNKHCCVSGNYYCFDNEAHYCDDGSFDPAVACICEGENGDIVNCPAAPEPESCTPEDSYLCSAEHTIMQCIDSKWLPIHETGSKLIAAYEEMSDNTVQVSSCSSNSNASFSFVFQSYHMYNFKSFISGDRGNVSFTVTDEYGTLIGDQKYCIEVLYNKLKPNQLRKSIIIWVKFCDSDGCTLELMPCDTSCNTEHNACENH